MSILNISVFILAIFVVLQVYSLRQKYKALSIKQVWLGKINELIDRGLFDEAENYGLSLLKGNLDDYDLYYSLGFCSYQLNRVNEAMDYFSKALTLNKKMAVAWYSLGYAYFHNKNKKEEAADCLKKAIKNSPSLKRAYNTLAIVLDTQGKAEKAFKLLSRSVKKYGGEPNSFNTLGLLAFKNRDFVAAEGYFNSSLELENSPETLCNLGNLHSMQMDYGQAVEVFEKAEVLSPKNKQIKYWTGSSLYLNREYKKACTKFDEAIALDNSFAPAFLQRAFANKKLGKNNAFLSDYEKAVQLDPSLRAKGDQNEH